MRAGLRSKLVRGSCRSALGVSARAEPLEGRLLMASDRVEGVSPVAEALEPAVSLAPAPGVLDPSFGRDGTFVTDFVAADTAVSGMATPSETMARVSSALPFDSRAGARLAPRSASRASTRASMARSMRSTKASTTAGSISGPS